MELQDNIQKLDYTIQKKINVSKEKMEKLALGKTYFQKSNIKMDAVHKYIKKVSQKIKQLWEKYTELYPESIEIIQHNEEIYHVIDKLTHSTRIKERYLTFNYELTQTKSNLEYLCISHPLINNIITQDYVNSINHSVYVNKQFKNINFYFLVTLEHYLKEKIIINIKINIENKDQKKLFSKVISPQEFINQFYQKGILNLKQKIKNEEYNIIQKHNPLIEAEIKKIKHSFEIQIDSMKKLIQAYEFKNKNLDQNSSILLHKSKENLSHLIFQREKIIATTRSKAKINSSYTLQSIIID